jgi:hypothetical protein
MKQFANSHSRFNKWRPATCCHESVAETTEPEALGTNMRSLGLGLQCLGHCSSSASVAAAEDRGVLRQQRWDARGCLRSSLAAVWFLTPNTCMCGAARTPGVKGLEHRALFDEGKPERKLCAYWVQTHSTGMGAHLFIYLFIEFVFIGPATVQPRDMPHELIQAREGYSMGAHRQRQHDLHLPFPIHVQLA